MKEVINYNLDELGVQIYTYISSCYVNSDFLWKYVTLIAARYNQKALQIILPLSGKIAWKLRLRACLAVPPAESPSTKNSSTLAGSFSWQKANFHLESWFFYNDILIFVCFMTFQLWLKIIQNW